MIQSEQYEQLLKSVMIKSRSLWFLITGFILIYIFVAYYVTFRPTNSEAEDIEIYKYIIYCSGILLTILSLILRTHISSQKSLTKQLKKEVKASDLAGNALVKKMKQEKLKMLIGLTEQEIKIMGLAFWYFRLFVLLLALFEAIAIFGLILALLTRFSAILPFAVISVLLCLSIYNGPSRIIEEGKKSLQTKICY